MRAFNLAVFITPLFLLGCSPDDKQKDNIAYVGANLLGYNHVVDTNINWFSVNGYRGRTGGIHLLCHAT